MFLLLNWIHSFFIDPCMHARVLSYIMGVASVWVQVGGLVQMGCGFEQVAQALPTYLVGSFLSQSRLEWVWVISNPNWPIYLLKVYMWVYIYLFFLFEFLSGQCVLFVFFLIPPKQIKWRVSTTQKKKLSIQTGITNLNL